MLELFWWRSSDEPIGLEGEIMQKPISAPQS